MVLKSEEQTDERTTVKKFKAAAWKMLYFNRMNFFNPCLINMMELNISVRVAVVSCSLTAAAGNAEQREG